jgi:ribosomal protein S18 acetylase RimI-like enzyme
METGGPLFAQLAVEVAPPASASTSSYNASAPAYTQYMAPRPQREHILGAVTASTLPLTKVEDPGLIASDDAVHTHVMYILTLGSRASVRRKGIASALLQECIDQAWRQPECGAVYLHVKADNISALRFYEKNGFRNLRYLQGASTWTLLGHGRKFLIVFVLYVI